MNRWTKVAVTGLLALIMTGGAFAESRDRDDRRDRDDYNYQRWERGRAYRGDRDDRRVYNNGWYGNRDGWYGNRRDENGWNGRQQRRDRDDRDRDRDGDRR